MDSGAGAAPRRKVPHWVVAALGYTISIGCLVWVYRGFDWRQELPKVLATDWQWIALAVAADVGVYVIQGWRWNLVLEPIARLPLWRSVQAVYIGLFANEILPLRSGEVIRCYLLAKWSGLHVSVVISSAVIERLFDGAWLVLGFYVVSHFVELPRYLVAGSEVLALILVGVGVLVVWAVAHKSHAHEAVSGSRWGAMLRHVIDGVHDMGRSRSFAVAGAVSFVYLALQVVPVYALMRGYGLELSFAAAAVVLTVLRLGSSPPQAPSNVGAFQFFTVVGLQLFGVGRADATGFATLLFIVVTAPLWAVGFAALLATRMRLEEIHRDAHEHLGKARSEPRPAVME